jgi:hypothetical protein
MLTFIIAGVVAVVGIPLAVVLIRFNRKRLHIVRCAEAASDEQLEAVYAQIGLLGTEAPSCAVLARTNRRTHSEGDWIVPIPSYVGEWTSRSISADSGPPVEFRFSAAAAEPVLRGHVYRVVPVPRNLTKSGKVRSQFSPSKYVAGNPQLSKALAEVCPAYPSELLAYLLAAGAETFEFDPVFQARIGGSPAWVQGADFPVCGECRKRMSLILQLPGALLPGKPMREGTFFFFACATHQDRTETVAQFG